MKVIIERVLRYLRNTSQKTAALVTELCSQMIVVKLLSLQYSEEHITNNSVQ